MNTTRDNPTIDASAASGGAGAHESGASERAADSIEAARERATEAIETTRAWIVENPAAAIGIAVGTGFLVGRVVRR